jgi:hypothetical protein
MLQTLQDYVGVSRVEIEEIWDEVSAWYARTGHPATIADIDLTIRVWSDVADKFLVGEFLYLLPSDMTAVLAKWRAK